jgi:hypothetical protein
LGFFPVLWYLTEKEDFKSYFSWWWKQRASWFLKKKTIYLSCIKVQYSAVTTALAISSISSQQQTYYHASSILSCKYLKLNLELFLMIHIIRLLWLHQLFRCTLRNYINKVPNSKPFLFPYLKSAPLLFSPSLFVLRVQNS